MKRSAKTEEEKELDKANHDGMREMLDTIMYMRESLHKEIPPEFKEEVLELIRLYGAVYSRH